MMSKVFFLLVAWFSLIIVFPVPSVFAQTNCPVGYYAVGGNCVDEKSYKICGGNKVYDFGTKSCYTANPCEVGRVLLDGVCTIALSEWICPDGLKWDKSSKDCVSLKEICGPNYRWAPTLDSCVCTGGIHPETGQCVASCPFGFGINEEGNCVPVIEFPDSPVSKETQETVNEITEGIGKFFGEDVQEMIDAGKDKIAEDIAGQYIEDSIDRAVGLDCLIATAAYGSPLAPEVQMLREIRDDQLLQTESGSAFMAQFNTYYYTFAPTVSDWENENPVFKEVVRTTITPLIASLSLLQYVSMDSEAEVLFYGISMILLNIGMYFVAPAIVIVGIRKRF